jgi:hypothetical protein
VPNPTSASLSPFFSVAMITSISAASALGIYLAAICLFCQCTDKFFAIQAELPVVMLDAAAPIVMENGYMITMRKTHYTTDTILVSTKDRRCSPSN